MINSLEKGLLLGDSNQLLTWDTSLKRLINRNKDKILKLGDRTTIEWGHHLILKGLKVNLTTTYLGPVWSLFLRKFRLIEHWEYGDKNAIEGFDRIGSHLQRIIGEPSELNENINGEREWTWTNSNTKLTLYLFQQHIYKLVFRINQVKQ